VRIDLHCHSNASDGTEPPAGVVERAERAGLDVLALTDHDTVAGYAEALRALPRLPRPARLRTLVLGMELSCRRAGRSLHLLGYLFDAEEPELAAERERLRTDRVRRARAMVKRLTGLGVPIDWEQVAAIAGDGVVGRPHIARAMVVAGAVETVPDAFTDRWLAVGGRAYVDRYALDPRRAVRLIRAAGGVCVLAHPRAGRGEYVLSDEDIAELAAAGVNGIEVDHPLHDSAERARLRSIAADLGLVVTGASDDHGRLTGHRLGCETTARSAYEDLVDRATGSPVTV
jgi:predicted metal-dependent phosphoesterase TrpH